MNEAALTEIVAKAKEVREAYDALADVAKADADVARWAGYLKLKEEVLEQEEPSLPISIKSVSAAEQTIDKDGYLTFSINGGKAIISKDLEDLHKAGHLDEKYTVEFRTSKVVFNHGKDRSSSGRVSSDHARVDQDFQFEVDILNKKR